MAVCAKITERFAAALAWKGSRYIVWDTDQEGFGVQVWGNGSRRAYIVQIKRDGKSARMTLGRVGEVKCEAARAVARQFRGAVKDGHDPRAEDRARRDAWTLQDAFDYFNGTYAEARKLSSEYQLDCGKLFENHVPKSWKSTKLTAVTHAMVVARHTAITGGFQSDESMARGGTRRANAFLSLMSRLFTLGIGQGQCTMNPASGIKKNDETMRERFLSPAEIKSLWTYLENHDNVEAAVLVQFVLTTGCRPGEAYKMMWEHLDRATGKWTKPSKNTKQRKRHVVMLSERTKSALNRLETYKRSDYVFPSPNDPSQPRGDKLKNFWAIARKKCALPDVRLYDCRHSFASYLAMGGKTDFEIAQQLGHTNVQTTRRYTHASLDHMQGVAEIMSKVIDKVLEDDNQLPIVAKLGKDGRVTTMNEMQSFGLEDDGPPDRID